MSHEPLLSQASSRRNRSFCSDVPFEMEANNRVSPPFNFDDLPQFIKDEIFLHVNPADLNECQTVSSDWRDLIADRIKQNRSYVEYMHEQRVAVTRRQIFGTIFKDKEVEVDTFWMLACCEESEQMFYTLSKPNTGNNWTLRQYSVANNLKEVNTATLITTRFVRNMKVVAGHLIFFPEPLESNNNNMPAVFSLASIPWGGHLLIKNSMPLPASDFHFAKLLLGRDCLYVMAKNAHVTWTNNKSIFSKVVYQSFEEPITRPVVVHKLIRESGSWQEVTRLYPQHEFRIMETFPNYPSRQLHPKYKDQTCFLLLSNNVITDRLVLVSCPLHGSYELYDYIDDFSMWTLDMPQLPFENIRSIIKDSQHNSSHVLAAIRRDYVFVYSEPGLATLVSVEHGTTMFQVKGSRFALSPRYVLPIKQGPGLGMRDFRVAVADSHSGTVSPTFAFERPCITTDAFGDMPWHHDDNAYGDLENIVKKLPTTRPTWPSLQRRAESYWGFGHSMLDSYRIVYWRRETAHTFKIGLGFIQHDEEGAGGGIYKSVRVAQK